MSWRDLYRLAVSHPRALAALMDHADRAVMASKSAELQRAVAVGLGTADALNLGGGASLMATYTVCRVLDAHAVPVPGEVERRIGELRRS